ncbi:MAG: NfeD family protein [candidate division Zixibacteria bacterium]|nr:NfeD family protein [candidate division Zixibacteria bacterium]
MPEYVWLILAGVLIIIEIFTAGFFIACFAVGALVAALLSYVTNLSFEWQCGIFAIVSVALIPLARSLGKRMQSDKIPQAGADALVGKTAVVIDTILPRSTRGQIRVDGDVWRAIASVEIKEGETVAVVSVKGAMLEVEKTERSL